MEEITILEKTSRKITDKSYDGLPEINFAEQEQDQVPGCAYDKRV